MGALLFQSPDTAPASAPHAKHNKQALVKAKLEQEVYPKFFGAFQRLLEQHGKGFFYGDQVRSVSQLAGRSFPPTFGQHAC